MIPYKNIKSMNLPINPIDSKIKDEQRRRNQVYQALDYLLPRMSYYDFFSLDTFELIQSAKDLAKTAKKDIVTSEIILLSLFYSSSTVPEATRSFGITYESILAFLPELKSLKRKRPKEINPSMTKKVTRFLTDCIDSCQDFDFTLFSSPKEVSFIEYSFEVESLFEKAVENAMTRFKTPVVTSEILFLTLLEEVSTRAGKLLKRSLKDNTEWHVLRYKLLKRLHYEESMLREQVVKNQQYFAYLLKTQLSPIEFDQLIRRKTLAKGTELFRNILVLEVLKIDLVDALYIDIHESIKAKKKEDKRKYSS